LNGFQDYSMILAQNNANFCSLRGLTVLDIPPRASIVNDNPQ